MSHLIGSHLQSLLLKQFHSLGGRKTGHQLCVSEERGRDPSPHTPTRPEQLGVSQEEKEKKQSHYMARPGPALLCKLSLGKPGGIGTWQERPLTSMAA